MAYRLRRSTMLPIPGTGMLLAIQRSEFAKRFALPMIINLLQDLRPHPSFVGNTPDGLSAYLVFNATPEIHLLV